MRPKITQLGPEAGIKNAWKSWANTESAICRWSRKAKCWGVISSTDLLLLTVSENDHIIEQLERYIASGF